MQAWHWVDITILGILLLSVLTGLIRGFVKELIALCVWAMAIWLAYHYAEVPAVWFVSVIHDPMARNVAGFVVILLTTLLVGSLLNAIFGFVLKRSGLSGTDRVLGMGFGLVRGAFIVSLIIAVINLTSTPHAEYTQQSVLYARFTPLVTWLQARMPDWLQQIQQADKHHALASLSGELEIS